MQRDVEKQIARVKVSGVKSPNRFLMLTKYEGNAEDVILAVAKKLAADDWTMMYDHMQLRIHKVEPGERGKLTIVTSKNSYAGD